MNAAATNLPAWAIAMHRVDPRGLDARRTFRMDERSITVHGTGAVIEGADGIARSVPARSFEGVAARALEDRDGNVTVTLELMHEDEALSVPLLVANDLDDVAADWRDWARQFGLAMLMVEADGSVSTLDEPGSPRAAEERRKRASRRPRFLVRRRTGELGVSMKIGGREIIARNPKAV